MRINLEIQIVDGSHMLCRLHLEEWLRNDEQRTSIKRGVASNMNALVLFRQLQGWLAGHACKESAKILAASTS